jgi:hypothetical protein
MIAPELSLVWIAIALTAGAVGVWRLQVTIANGWSEHIKAMQAFYDEKPQE